MSDTENDFSKAYNKALIHGLQHILNRDEASLISFSDMKKLLKPQNESYEGIKTIPVAEIVGSEDRYNDFDKEFFPKNLHLRTRWERIDDAHHKDIILPPILLYELGGLYFVRDGNHRVSVAKAQGIEFIDAEVVSLKTEIKLKPGLSYKKIKKQVITYEKRIFYTETNFGDITDYWLLDFSTTGQYDVVYNHILTHKYYINQSKTEEISIEEAILSWFTTVYLPIIKYIHQHNVMHRFPGRTYSDMYVWFIKYWNELKLKFGEDQADLDDSFNKFTEKFGTSFLNRIINRIKSIKLKS